MPTYEYECKKCGKIFEEFQSISAQPLTECIDESCKGEVHRLLSPGAGFLFKGSGFYITDYRSDSYKNAQKSESGNSSTKSSDSNKSDGSKTAKKSSTSSSD